MPASATWRAGASDRVGQDPPGGAQRGYHHQQQLLGVLKLPGGPRYSEGLPEGWSRLGGQTAAPAQERLGECKPRPGARESEEIPYSCPERILSPPVPQQCPFPATPENLGKIKDWMYSIIDLLPSTPALTSTSPWLLAPRPWDCWWTLSTSLQTKICSSSSSKEGQGRTRQGCATWFFWGSSGKYTCNVVHQNGCVYEEVWKGQEDRGFQTS